MAGNSNLKLKTGAEGAGAAGAGQAAGAGGRGVAAGGRAEGVHRSGLQVAGERGSRGGGPQVSDGDGGLMPSSLFPDLVLLI